MTASTVRSDGRLVVDGAEEGVVGAVAAGTVVAGAGVAGAEAMERSSPGTIGGVMLRADGASFGDASRD
jgi:hypothetical protein